MQTFIYIPNHNGAEHEIDIDIELSPTYTNNGGDDIFDRWEIDYVDCDEQYKATVLEVLENDHAQFEAICNEWEEQIES